MDEAAVESGQDLHVAGSVAKPLNGTGGDVVVTVIVDITDAANACPEEVVVVVPHEGVQDGAVRTGVELCVAFPLTIHVSERCADNEVWNVVSVAVASVINGCPEQVAGHVAPKSAG